MCELLIKTDERTSLVRKDNGIRRVRGLPKGFRTVMWFDSALILNNSGVPVGRGGEIVPEFSTNTSVILLRGENTHIEGKGWQIDLIIKKTKTK